MTLHEMTLPAFITELASSSPAPGGGSIAALGGALAAGLASMVGELTKGREKYAAIEADMVAIADAGKALADRLLMLIDEDTVAFDSYMAAIRLPKDTDAQKAARRAAIQAAAKVTTEVPLRTAAACVEALELTVLAVEKGNPNAVTDAATAGQFAHAGLMAAAYNVRINLNGIKDADWAIEKRAELAALIARGDQAFAAITAAIEKALA